MGELASKLQNYVEESLNHKFRVILVYSFYFLFSFPEGKKKPNRKYEATWLFFSWKEVRYYYYIFMKIFLDKIYLQIYHNLGWVGCQKKLACSTCDPRKKIVGSITTCNSSYSLFFLPSLSLSLTNLVNFLFSWPPVPSDRPSDFLIFVATRPFASVVSFSSG